MFFVHRNFIKNSLNSHQNCFDRVINSQCLTKCIPNSLEKKLLNIGILFTIKFNETFVKYFFDPRPFRQSGRNHNLKKIKNNFYATFI